MSFQTKGVIERLEAALKKAEEHMDMPGYDTGDAERAYVTLADAINAEIATIKAIRDMPAFRAWFAGERFDLSKIRGRK